MLEKICKLSGTPPLSKNHEGKDMEENRINKTVNIETRIYPETKAAFLSKLSDANIPSYRPFLAWVLDKWAESEVSGINAVSSNVRHIISLMPKQVVPRGFKFKDTIFCSKYGINQKRYEWIGFLIKTARESPYQRITNVVRCLVYAIIIAPSDLVRSLAYEMVEEKIGTKRFDTKEFNGYIPEHIANKIKELYNISPATIARKILDVLLLPDSTDIKSLILPYFTPINKITPDHCKGKSTSIIVEDDFYRLKVFDFMYEHGISTRAGLIYSLLDVALELPSILNPLFTDIAQVRTREALDDESYERDLFHQMSVKYYKYTGL